MLGRLFALGFLAACLLGGLLRAADGDRLSSVERRYYSAVKPRADETRWRQIPWMQDLAAAAKQAKKEKRPLFLWESGDEPLERC